jgi:uncharacterized protein involved in exopolysaccharide biosynthesis
MEDISWLWNVKFLKRAVIGVIICILSVCIFTMPFLVPAEYESETIVYAPPAILPQQLNQQGIGFGNDKEIDWYIQVLKSNSLADSLEKRFHLFKNFAIDTGNSNAKSELYQALKSRVHIDKTRYNSVLIKVRDTDAKRAAAIANSIVEVAEIIKAILLHPNRLESLKYTQSLFEQKVSEVSSLGKKLDSLKRALTPQSNSSDILLYNNISEAYNQNYKELTLRKDQYEVEKKSFNTPLPKAYIISGAIPEFRAAWPKRGLIASVVVAIYLIFLIVYELIKRDIREKL